MYTNVTLHLDMCIAAQITVAPGGASDLRPSTVTLFRLPDNNPGMAFPSKALVSQPALTDGHVGSEDTQPRCNKSFPPPPSP